MKKGIYAILTVLFAAVMIFTSCDTGSSPSSSLKYGVTFTPKSPITLAEVSEGYTTVPTQKVTVSNAAGNGATGELTVALTGTDKDSFKLSVETINSIAAGKTADFTIEANPGLTAKAYTAKVTVTNTKNKINASITVNLKVNEAGSTIPTYGITVTPNPLTFDPLTVGYTQPAARMVTVTNPAGNAETGDLTVELGGTNAASFTLSKTSITSIDAGGDDTFTVVPKTGLTAGTYTATVAVSNDNIIINNFVNVTFTVNPAPTYSITVAPPTYTFPAAVFGYAQPTAQPVTVSNAAGNAATGDLTVALGGTNAASFTLSKTSITSIDAGGNDTFTVVPKTGLTAGAYTATVTVSNTNVSAATVTVNFTVDAHAYSISVAPTTHTFTAVSEGYTPVTPQTVTITNTGNVATGDLIVALSSASSFNLSTTTLTSIGIAANNKSDTFTVEPKTGLAAGDYTATITVSNSDITANNTIEVSITVNPASRGITLDPASSFEFTEAHVGYTQPAAKLVTVTNTGAVDTGPLSVELSGAAASSFTLSGASIASLSVGGTDTFTVQPNADLPAGGYTATITVSNTSGEITARLGISFTVTKQDPVVGDFDIVIVSANYDGNSHLEEVTITPKAGKSDGTITKNYSPYPIPINAGVYTVTFDVAETDAWNQAENLAAGTFTIIAKPITAGGIVVELIPNQKATGSEIEPGVVIMDGIKELILGTDFEVGYDDNIDIGEAKVTITGKGNYKDTTEVKFNIIATDPGAEITVSWEDDGSGLAISGEAMVQAGERVIFTSTVSADSVVQWSVDGVQVATEVDNFSFSSLNIGTHNVGLVVVKDGKLYSTTIVVTVVK